MFGPIDRFLSVCERFRGWRQQLALPLAMPLFIFRKCPITFIIATVINATVWCYLKVTELLPPEESWPRVLMSATGVIWVPLVFTLAGVAAHALAQLVIFVMGLL